MSNAYEKNQVMAFTASCAECEFEVSVDTVGEVLDRQEEHYWKYDSSHVLEFEAHQAH